MVISDKKNFVYKKDLICKEYYKLSELIDIKNSIDSTIEKYKKNNLNDEIINHLNIESSKKINSYFPNIKKEKQGIYLISNGKDFLKIGITIDISRRLKEIKFANPSEIKVLFFIKDNHLLEKILHLKFDNYRISNEWFKYDDSILDAFEVIKNNKDMFSKIECKHILKEKLNNLISKL